MVTRRRGIHRQRPESERDKESATYGVPVTAHPVIIFYDLMEEANGLASACGTPP